MTVIAKDRYVVLESACAPIPGNRFGATPKRRPICNSWQATARSCPGLERRLWGLREQEAVEFIVPAAEAFGAYEPENIQVWSPKVFPPDLELRVDQKVLPPICPSRRNIR